ncbi:MAG: hypothetical protein CL512_04005 [Actinobacteria bacterium]|nr:hypothetical protein [Actinomycetota bacterium]
MKPQFQHEVTTSFVLWFDHYLLERGTAFKDFTTPLYLLEDDRMPGFYSYSSPYKQWVFDKSVTDAKVLESISSATRGELTRSDGVIVDYENGRVLLPEDSFTNTEALTATYSVKDFNIYVTNQTEEELITEGNFDTNSRFKQEEFAITPYSQVLPAVFISNQNSRNEPFALGGEDQTVMDLRCVVMAENTYQLDGVLSIFNDSSREVFAKLKFEDYPLTEYGDCVDFFYNSLQNQRIIESNQRDICYVDRVTTSKLSDRVSKRIDPNLFVGFVDFTISSYRFPRI